MSSTPLYSLPLFYLPSHLPLFFRFFLPSFPSSFLPFPSLHLTSRHFTSIHLTPSLPSFLPHVYIFLPSSSFLPLPSFLFLPSSSFLPLPSFLFLPSSSFLPACLPSFLPLKRLDVANYMYEGKLYL